MRIGNERIPQNKEQYIHIIIDKMRVWDSIRLDELYYDYIKPAFQSQNEQHNAFFYFENKSIEMNKLLKGKVSFVQGGFGVSDYSTIDGLNIFQDHKSNQETCHHVTGESFRPITAHHYDLELGYFGNMFYYESLHEREIDIYRKTHKNTDHLMPCVQLASEPFYPHKVFVHSINQVPNTSIQEYFSKQNILFQEGKPGFPLTKGYCSSELRSKQNRLQPYKSIHLTSLINQKGLPKGTEEIAIFFPYVNESQSQIISDQIYQIDHGIHPENQVLFLDVNAGLNKKLIAAMDELSLAYKFVALGKNKNGDRVNLTSIGKCIHISSEEQVKKIIFAN